MMKLKFTVTCEFLYRSLKQIVRETQILKLVIKDTLRYALCAEGTPFTAM